MKLTNVSAAPCDLGFIFDFFQKKIVWPVLWSFKRQELLLKLALLQKSSSTRKFSGIWRQRCWDDGNCSQVYLANYSKNYLQAMITVTEAIRQGATFLDREQL